MDKSVFPVPREELDLWRLVNDHTTNPKMNLAKEEAILRARQEDACLDTLRFWMNERSVIIGCFGDAKREVDLEMCRRNGVDLVRRISGGGAVYQDLGNLNLSVIAKSSLIKLPDDVLKIYEFISNPLKTALLNMGVEAEFHPPNSIFSNGRKVSGLALHRLYDTWLIHGTLLIDVDLSTLCKVLLRPKAPVANITDLAPQKLTVDDARLALANSFRKFLDIDFEEKGLSEDELTQAENLLQLKYSRQNWNMQDEEQCVQIELYIAEPPTTMCEKLVQLTQEALSSLDTPSKLIIRRQGDTPAFCHSLAPTVPAILVNGTLKFDRRIPSEEELIESIRESYVKVLQGSASK